MKLTIKGTPNEIATNMDLLMDRLEQLGKPLCEILASYCDPYCSIVITQDEIKMIRSEIGIQIR